MEARPSHPQPSLAPRSPLLADWVWWDGAILAGFAGHVSRDCERATVLVLPLSPFCPSALLLYRVYIMCNYQLLHRALIVSMSSCPTLLFSTLFRCGATVHERLSGTVPGDALRAWVLGAARLSCRGGGECGPEVGCHHIPWWPRRKIAMPLQSASWLPISGSSLLLRLASL